MSLTEREIRTIVDRITAELDRGGRAASPSAGAAVREPGRSRSPEMRLSAPTGGMLGIFETVDQAV
ncbi:MAG TPA: hypothetical protein VFQ21_01295, partial [Gemmatimonadota bacterium]|nr:hypothetical protein [Gemmatimonadota bacterium]